MYVLELAGEDDAFAAYEAASAAVPAGPAAVEVVAPGLATAPDVDPGRVRVLAYTRRASDLVARTAATVEAAAGALVAADLDRAGTVAVRARDVRGTAGVDTRAAERALGDVLVERGFAVDLETPDHELRALFSGDACLLGWLAAESVRDYGDRRPTDRPFFQPGSMAPLLARALANVAGARPGATLLDPMCGTGGVLVEAGLAGARAVGADAQPGMVRGARENLAAYLPADSDAGRAGRDGDPDSGHDGFDLLVADARHLPVRDGAVDAVVFDAPYGRQSKVAAGDLSGLVAGALGEARRVVRGGGEWSGGDSNEAVRNARRRGGRAVVVGDRPRTDAAEAAGWTVAATFERRVHRSLTRHVMVLN